MFQSGRAVVAVVIGVIAALAVAGYFVFKPAEDSPKDNGKRSHPPGFKDVTDSAGLTCIKHSQTAIFFYYDNDGLLDLFVTNTAEWTSANLDPTQRYYPGPSGLAELARSPKEYNILYHNNGDGTFTDV